MFIVAAVVLSILTVPLLGGRLSSLDALRIRLTSVLVTALAIQIVIISVIPDQLPGVHAPAHIASYLLAGAFFWANRRVPGLWLVGLGGGLNFAAIAANGGVMPASPHALAASSGPTAAPGAFMNSAPLEGARLSFLGDIFSLPANWPLSNVFSIGDVLIVVGALLALHLTCASRLAFVFPERLRSTV